MLNREILPSVLSTKKEILREMLFESKWRNLTFDTKAEELLTRLAVADMNFERENTDDNKRLQVQAESDFHQYLDTLLENTETALELNKRLIKLLGDYLLQKATLSLEEKQTNLNEIVRIGVLVIERQNKEVEEEAVKATEPTLPLTRGAQLRFADFLESKEKNPLVEIYNEFERDQLREEGTKVVTTPIINELGHHEERAILVIANDYCNNVYQNLMLADRVKEKKESITLSQRTADAVLSTAEKCINIAVEALQALERPTSKLEEKKSSEAESTRKKESKKSQQAYIEKTFPKFFDKLVIQSTPILESTPLAPVATDAPIAELPPQRPSTPRPGNSSSYL